MSIRTKHNAPASPSGARESGWGMGVAERRGGGGGGEDRGWGGLSLTIAAVVPPTAASRSILWED